MAIENKELEIEIPLNEIVPLEIRLALENITSDVVKSAREVANLKGKKLSGSFNVKEVSRKYGIFNDGSYGVVVTYSVGNDNEEYFIHSGLKLKTKRETEN